MDCSTPGLLVHRRLPEFNQTHVHWVRDAMQLSHPLLSPYPSAFNLSQHWGLFQWISSSHQVAKVLDFSASASVLPMNIQGWFHLGWTGWISLQSKRLSRVFSNTTSILQHQFFGAQPFSQSNSDIHTWPLEKPVSPKEYQTWIFTERTDGETEAPILWPPDTKNWLIRKDPDAGKDWRREKKGTTEDEMVGWHHRLNGHEFEQALGNGDGQGGLACCSPWGHKESDMTEQVNNSTFFSEMSTWPQMRQGEQTVSSRCLIIQTSKGSSGEQIASCCYSHLEASGLADLL